jgi:hypothetical protein
MLHALWLWGSGCMAGWAAASAGMGHWGMFAVFFVGSVGFLVVSLRVEALVVEDATAQWTGTKRTLRVVRGEEKP